MTSLHISETAPEAELMMQALRQGHSLFYLHLKPDGHYVYANEVYRQRFFAADESLEQHVHTYAIHPDDVAFALEITQKCLDHPAQVFELTLRKYDVVGQLMYTRWMVMGVMQPHNKVEILCIGYEISPVNVEAELLEHATQKLKALMNNSFDQSLLLTTRGVVLGFNKAAQQKMLDNLGVQLSAGLDLPEAIAGFPWQPQFVEVLRQVGIGKPFNAEFQYRTGNGPARWYRTEISPVYDGDTAVKSISIVIADVDALKRSQLHLQHQNAYLMEIAQMQSHHIRRPVANIKGLLHLMRQEELSPALVQYVDLLDASAEDADAVIREVVAKTISARQQPD